MEKERERLEKELALKYQLEKNQELDHQQREMDEMRKKMELLEKEKTSKDTQRINEEAREKELYQQKQY